MNETELNKRKLIELEILANYCLRDNEPIIQKFGKVLKIILNLKA